MRKILLIGALLLSIGVSAQQVNNNPGEQLNSVNNIVTELDGTINNLNSIITDLKINSLRSSLANYNSNDVNNLQSLSSKVAVDSLSNLVEQLNSIKFKVEHSYFEPKKAIGK